MPTVELHRSSSPIFASSKVFEQSGLETISNARLEPEIVRFHGGWGGRAGGLLRKNMMPMMDAHMVAESVASVPAGTVPTGSLKSVDRVRTFFPETWFWRKLDTSSSDSSSMKLTVPDSITTWCIHGIGQSLTEGVGVLDDELIAFSPFFVSVDTEYSIIKGEQVPVKIAIYNYLKKSQKLRVELTGENFESTGKTNTRSLTLESGGVGSVEFNIVALKVGSIKLKVICQSSEGADAIEKVVIVVPPGTERETVANYIVRASEPTDLHIPLVSSNIVEDSQRIFLNVIGNIMGTVMNGLEKLLKMPFGCGNAVFLVSFDYFLAIHFLFI
jgi:CD109 antigen